MNLLLQYISISFNHTLRCWKLSREDTSYTGACKDVWT